MSYAEAGAFDSVNLRLYVQPYVADLSRYRCVPPP